MSLPQPVSLWDMLKLYARDFAYLGAALSEMGHGELEGTMPHELLDDERFATAEKALGSIRHLAQRLDMGVTAGLAGRLRKEFRAERPTYGFLRDSFRTLEQCAQVELKKRWLLFLPEHLAAYYLHGPAPFGDAVAERFPSAAYDIREACKCLALGRDTAAVFHLMRVLEKGLGALAREHNVPFQYENWKNVIDGIESRIRALEALPKGKAKSDELVFQSKAALDFRYFKDAWRNHVSHGREPYDSDEAASVFRHVESFMRHLAARLAE